MVRKLAWNAYLAYHLLGQARLPFRSPTSIERIQARRIRSIVAHAYRTVPFYRETLDRLRLRPADFRSAADLSRLPIIEKEQLQRQPEQFRSSAYRDADCLRLRTGGSTGIACTVDINTAALFQNAAQGERERCMVTPLVGRGLGYRETIIGSPTTTDRVVQEYCQSRGFFPSAMRMERQYLSLVNPPEENLRAINRFQPRLIRSYGSYLEELFPFIYRTGAEFRAPKVVTYSSDSLSPSVRRMITDTFGIPVFSYYECVEAFKLGFECDHSTGVHQNVDLYPITIVDARGNPVPDGTSGEVVVSNLVNRATVLLNYRLGDVATRFAEPCPCGRTLPLLSLPEGRSDEFLTLPDGRRVHPQSVRTAVLDEDAVWQFQAVQEATGELRVSVVADPGADRGQLHGRLVSRLERVFAGQLRVEVAFVESIPRRQSGSKFRVVVSKVGSPEIPRSVSRTAGSVAGHANAVRVQLGGIDLLHEARLRGDGRSRRAADYLLPLVPDGAPGMIDNARVQVRVAMVNRRLVPLVITQSRRRNSEVCDLRTHYLDYVPMQHARRGRLAESVVSRFRNAPARLLFALGGVHRVIYANNHLFSTNPDVGLDEEALRHLTQHLVDAYPRHAIVFRSINPTTGRETFQALQGVGYEMIRSRTVLLADPSDPCTLRRHNNVKDRRLLRKTPYRVLTDQADLLRHTVRIAQLYRGLYLGKHPGHNAAYNERFFAHAISARVWEFFAFELDGRIDAFASYFIDRDYLVGAVIGYDLSRPRSAGLYRLIVARLLSEAATRGLQFHMSSGAADFKMLRGGVPDDEFDAVYDRHMPRRFRAACRYLRWASNRQATPPRSSS